MKTKIWVAAVAATMFATPVLADFFIVREGVKGPCRVVDTRPTDARILVVGNKAYTVREDAEREIASLCPTAVEAQLLRPRPRSSCPPLSRPHLLRPQAPRPRLLRPRLFRSRFLRPRVSIRVGPSQTAQQIQWAKPAIRAPGDNWVWPASAPAPRVELSDQRRQAWKAAA